MMSTPDELERSLLLAEIKALAVRYHAMFRRPLGVTGEIAESEAVTRLGLQIADARQAGWDAKGDVLRNGEVQRLQIKGRRLVAGAKRSQRVPDIDLSHEFEGVLLVLLDERYEATEILYQSAATVRARLSAPGSRARNERGSMSIPQFRRGAAVLFRASPEVASPNG